MKLNYSETIYSDGAGTEWVAQDKAGNTYTKTTKPNGGATKQIACQLNDGVFVGYAETENEARSNAMNKAWDFHQENGGKYTKATIFFQYLKD